MIEGTEKTTEYNEDEIKKGNTLLIFKYNDNVIIDMCMHVVCSW